MAGSGGVAISPGVRQAAGRGPSRGPAPPAQNKNRAPKPGQAHPGPGTRGHWVPQGDTWQLIHAVGKGKWAPGPVKGHGAPPRPKGPTPLPDNPLSPLTQNQIRRQATSTISAAYKPGLTDLGGQEKTAQNLYATQTSDDHAFSQWLSSQQSSLNSQIDAINQRTQGVVKGLVDAQNAAQAAQPGALTQASMGAPSQAGVAAPGQDQAALGAVSMPAAVAAQGRTADAAAQAAEQGVIQQNAGMNTGEVAQARLQAEHNTQLGQLNKTLTGIAQERTKLVAGQAGDIAKEITRLQGVELNKRQWQINESALLQKTGMANANIMSEIGARAANAQTARLRAKTADTAAKETAKYHQTIAKINAAHYASQAARDAAKQRATDAYNQAKLNIEQQKVGIAQQNANTNAFRAAHGTAKKGSSPFGTPSQQRAVVNYTEKVRQALMTDIQRFHAGDPQAIKLAWHDLNSGRYFKYYPSLGKPPAGADHVGYLNAAANTLTQYGGGGLTPGDIAFLNRQGLQVGNRYPRAGGGQARSPLGPGVGHR